MSSLSAGRAQRMAHQSSSGGEPEPRAVTVIPGRHLNTSKLEGLLSDRFGDRYSVEIRYTEYKVFAPHQLSQREIAKCR
ncbi:hypothetical protein GQ53DRAFT_750868 [Thozetella sp. PMI_491]|nr:hypothetical protein GQ53DRAFT_750868 [Thozetella sp. PMI_491]